MRKFTTLLLTRNAAVKELAVLFAALTVGRSSLNQTLVAMANCHGKDMEMSVQTYSAELFCMLTYWASGTNYGKF